MLLLRHVCHTLSCFDELVGEAPDIGSLTVSASTEVILSPFIASHSQFDAGFTFESVVLLSDPCHILPRLIDLFVQYWDFHELTVNSIDPCMDVCDLPIQTEEVVLFLVFQQVESCVQVNSCLLNIPFLILLKSLLINMKLIEFVQQQSNRACQSVNLHLEAQQLFVVLVRYWCRHNIAQMLNVRNVVINRGIHIVQIVIITTVNLLLHLF